MPSLDYLFENNRRWAEELRRKNPDFFPRIARKQTPPYLWIGCSDSRVPANQLLGLPPGEVFVHRNIANLIIPSDLNCLSVMQFAIEILKVRDVIVCGHSNCGGVLATLRHDRLGLIDNWLRHLQNVRQKHDQLIQSATSEAEAAERLCRLNVIEQVANVSQTTIAQDAWARGQELSVHGWVYDPGEGLLRDLNFTMSGPQDSSATYEKAVAKIGS